MSWLKKLGDDIWSAGKKAVSSVQAVVSNKAVQSVAEVVGLGGVTSMVSGALNTINPIPQPVAEVVQAQPVVQPVAEVVQERKPSQIVQAVEKETKEIAQQATAVQVKNNGNYMPIMIAGGMGLALLLIARK